MSRTYNPIHFEDLDPKRFEDLIRGLAYDFRDWREIEATGRKGNDKGFDIRAWEKPVDDDEEDIQQEKKWLIQCKREQKIGPKKAKQYAEDILKENSDLYGVLFVASADLSIDARDAIRKTFAEGGVTEVSIWSRSEIEDQLYQPKNDHLLFAYFGFSIVKRKQSMKTKVRAKLAAKRKVTRILGEVNEFHYRDVLVINSEYSDYPMLPKNYAKLSVPERPFIQGCFLRHYYGGIIVYTGEFYAYVDKEKQEYDIEERHNLYHNGPSDSELKPNKTVLKNHYNVALFQDSIDANKQYHYYECYVVPYENIIDIDEAGDEYNDDPHIIVSPNDQGQTIRKPRVHYFYQRVGWANGSIYLPFDHKYKRISFFPKRYPKPKPPKENKRNYVKS